jgi:hypothetical protein
MKAAGPPGIKHRARRWPVAAVAVLMLALPAVAATAMPAVAGPPGPFVTLLFSRTELTAADNCVANNTNVARLDTTVAPYLASLGMRGTGTIVTSPSRTAAVNAGCIHYNSTKSASWSQAAALGSNYGWSFVSHTATYPTGDLSKLSPTRAFNETCGSADAIQAHGLRGAHGLIAYPGTDTGILALQQQYGARCFAWGRKYGNNGLTLQSAATTAPFWQRTMAVDGGSCNDPAAACYNTPGATSRYHTPASVIAAINALQPGQWMTIQAYVLVTGTNPPYTSSTIRWDCTSSNPALHWSNDNERYCYSDYQRIIVAVAAKGIPTIDPLSVGVAFGRPASYP